MTLDELTEFFRAVAPAASALNASIKLDFGEAGCIVIDATNDPVSVSNDSAQVDTTIHANLERFGRMLNGELKGDMEFLMGRLTMEGDLITGMKVTSLLNRAG
ncbi:MAG: SCP2 sterol-binding domain-containing protein [Pseudomonadota bacterium]